MTTRDTAHWCQCRHAQFQETIEINEKQKRRDKIFTRGQARPAIQVSTVVSNPISFSPGWPATSSATHCSHLSSRLPPPRDLNIGFFSFFFIGNVSPPPSGLGSKHGRKRNRSATEGGGESHHSFPVRAGRNVSCLCRRWSGPAGCGC